jgi:hypothetical protein
MTYVTVSDNRDHQGRWIARGEFAETRKLLESTLKRAVKQDRADRLRAACERILDIAANDPEPRNAMMAFSIIADRLDGKAVARIETSDGDTRNMGLADLVQLVLNARKADAIDAPTHEQAEPAPGAETEQR